MPRFENMRDRLPSLYRPEEGDTSLLTQYLGAIARVLEGMNREATEVMQSHWFDYADYALYDPVFIRSRQLQKLPPPSLGDPALLQNPYIADLAHLASLLALPPWQQPPAQREIVEAYRLRIERIVALYRRGLGTPDALRRMVEAQLPLDLAAPPGRRDRPFWIEEFAPVIHHALDVKMLGDPVDLAGPLMRWTLSNTGEAPAAPSIYITGVEPVPDQIDATQNPVIELYHMGDSAPRIGIAYQGIVAPNQTLRLRPTSISWLGVEGTILMAQALPTETAPADPTAPGPWQALPGVPDGIGAVVAFHRSDDFTLWIAANTDTNGVLWRYNGQALSEAVGNLAKIRCLAQDEQDLLIGTESGLLRMHLYPPDGTPLSTSQVAGLNGKRVNALFKQDGSTWLAGTEDGLAQLGEGDSVKPFVLGSDEESRVEVFAISRDKAGILYFGTALGLFQYQTGTDEWFWYSGETSDWVQFLPDASGDKRQFPSSDRVFLPPIHAVHRGGDASLWLGTENGIARYTSRPASETALDYDVALEAFPDLSTGRVSDIREDERGIVWFCTDRGLFRYDGRDMWQFQADSWVQLGRADTLYTNPVAARGSWRFLRASSQWQQLMPQTSTWAIPALPVRSTAESPVLTVAWTDTVTADLGQWDGKQFTGATPVDARLLKMRYKPAEDRIIDGGMPAIPRLPVGVSTWRYLSLEPENLAEPNEKPSWSVEGRLFPPPSDAQASVPGRFRDQALVALLQAFFDGNFNEVVFAYNPAARVAFRWEAKHPLAVLVRLKRRAAGDQIDPAILDRVWQGIQQVRPAGVLTLLAVDEEIVRGQKNGTTG